MSSTIGSARGSTAPWRSAVLTAIATLFAGCAGPERAPHQPVTGVNRPAHERAPNPHDIPETRIEDEDPDRDGGGSPRGASVPTEGGGDTIAAAPPTVRSSVEASIDAFVQEVVGAVSATPGEVAIFWPISRHPSERDRRHVNGLGERLVLEVGDRMRDAGVDPIDGGALKRKIRDANRSLASYREPEDAFGLAERIGARYVIHGSVDLVSYRRVAKDQQLRLSLRCRDLYDEREVATMRESVSGGQVGRDLYRDFQLPGDVTIGDDAGTFRPRTDLEAKILMALLARRVMVKHGVQLEGRRVLIEPTVIRAVHGPRAERQALMAAFDRAFQRALVSAKSAGVQNPEIEALKQPFQYADHEFTTLSHALDFIERERSLAQAESAETLSVDLSHALTESLRAAGGNFQAMGGEAGRDAILAVVSREAAAADSSGAVDPATISRLRQSGVEVLVRSTLREYLGAYQLRLIVHDMKTNQTVTESIEFEPQFRSDLTQFTG